MKTFNLVDSAFSDWPYSVRGATSENMKWDRTLSTNGSTFYTHENSIMNSGDNSNNYALFVESRAILPGMYSLCESPLGIEHLSKYKNVFTHNSELLNKLTNSRWIPGGGIWIGNDYGGSNVRMHYKNRLCSFVSSNKLMCEGHKFRYTSYLKLKAKQKNVDYYGTIDGDFVQISKTLEKYAFSIVFENYVDDMYFTEKILNCFATGTIPIYYGASKIKYEFDERGILSFNSYDELEYIVKHIISTKYYEATKDSIKENFELCKKYRLIEDYIYENYL